ncbi:hemolysin family protein [Porphyromonas sp. COT-239 OH1446]|uniref:hemolysin family protein n=1 Tax=Porphyromonas sp. COT-239 OH1446 TaxID=1515613 RepID=UPI00052D449F|nr:hemolysin family protein [Porphyromonas sp. COT-239 OH1446]KGN68424.1 hemolysin [Porphyromonas sp. COT-239 OH1446]
MIYLYLLISLLLSAFFSGMEIAFVSSDKLRLELDRSRGGLTARALNLFYGRPDHFITTMLLGNNVVLVIYGLLVARLLEPWLESFLQSDVLVLLVQSLLGTLLILFMGEFIPKVTFRTNPNETMRFFSPVVLLIYLLLYPFVYIIGWITRGLLLLLGQRSSQTGITPSLSVADLEHYLESNQPSEGEEGELDTEVSLIQKALYFPSLQVRDCLIPRNEIVGVELGADIQELEEKFVRTGLSKIIVYRGSIDDVVGYIHSSEMFRGENWQDRIVPAVFVPESMYVNKLMTQLMQRKKSIAIVIDELGGTAGMITLEDVVEEIFGDIEDEHDHQKLTAKQVDEHTYILSARLEIDDVNERFGLSLPEHDDFMTIAGLILHHHQSIPAQGEVIEIEGLRFEILRSSATKIVLVRLSIL